MSKQSICECCGVCCKGLFCCPCVSMDTCIFFWKDPYKYKRYCYQNICCLGFFSVIACLIQLAVGIILIAVGKGFDPDNWTSMGIGIGVMCTICLTFTFWLFFCICCCYCVQMRFRAESEGGHYSAAAVDYQPGFLGITIFKNTE